MIHVIATIELRDGQRDAFLATFRELVPLVRAEEGCLEYGPAGDAATDMAAQIPRRANVVTVVEKSASVEHLKRHLDAPHMEAFRARVNDLVVGLALAVLTPA